MRVYRVMVCAALLVTAGFWVASPTRLRGIAAPESSTSSPASDEVVQWIAAHAIRIDSAQPGTSFRDLRPLRKPVGKASIVALGEATHGTHEFFTLKHRMLEFLATRMGFNTFAIEANMPEAYRLNDYILTGRGDPEKLLKGMYFWTWNTREVLDMIRWMRRFNQSRKGHLQFTGFDMQTPDVAVEVVRDFIHKFDSDYASSFEDASRRALAAKEQAPGPDAPAGVGMAGIPIAPLLGKTVRFRGYIKTRGITNGWAGLWWRVDGMSGPLNFDNMQNRGPTGTTDWTLCEIKLPVSPEAQQVQFGILHSGNGAAWFDGLSIEADGHPYPTDAIDFDFESAASFGFNLRGKGYELKPDNQIFHSGKQSLRIEKLEPNVERDRLTNPVTAASSWAEVVRHLTESQAMYHQENASNNDISWSIQNANIVLQCMLMKAGQVSRDASMAKNIEWILKRSPGTKLVVWAHNGHVAASDYAYREPPMGSFLRKRFGNQFRNFGFAFDHGSFQAKVVTNDLRDFTVGPARSDSLDATLSRTQIPIFILDLRLLPASGPVMEWFKAPHLSRRIGALYSVSKEASYFMNIVAPQSFDALVFVADTTAAQENGKSPR